MKIEINNISEDRLYNEQFIFVTMEEFYDSDLKIILDEASIQQRDTTRKKFKNIKYYERIRNRDNNMSKDEAISLMKKYNNIASRIKEYLLDHIIIDI